MEVNRKIQLIKMKNFILASILIIVTAMLMLCFSAKANAENTGGTAAQREDEKTLVRLAAALSRGSATDNKVNIDTLTELLNRYVVNGTTSVEEVSDIITVTFVSTGNKYEINADEGPAFETTEDYSNWVSVSEIYDSNGTNEEGLHIGDFVNYDAGTWTQEEIDAIQTGKIGSLVTANGSTSLPTKVFQFGGFTAGMSRNGNATPGDIQYDITTEANDTYNYVKDASTGEALTGWRVFDIDGDKVTLISAGNPEDYRLVYGTNNAYISEYILTGNIISAWSEDASNYQKRDWSDYLNAEQKAESVTILTTSKLNDWYSKYIVENADIWNRDTFALLFETPKYANIIDNYSAYWLVDSGGTYMDYIEENYIWDVQYGAPGVRLLVTLSSDVQFTATKTGTKTVTGGNMATYGGDQTYNCWNIQ